MKDIKELNHLFALKNVYRAGYFEGRKESSAEHSWGCQLLALYFLKQVKGLDEDRVLKLLIYHDVVEIESGDTFILDEKAKQKKKQKELEGFHTLIKNMPSTLTEEYKEFFNEYEENKTKEAQFAHAVDKLEPMIQWLYKVENWKEWGFTEENLRRTKEAYVKPFPVLHKFFNELMEYLKKENYFEEK